MPRALRIWLTLVGAACAVLLLSLALGSSQFAFSEVVRVLFRPDTSAATEVIHQLRLPRALAAFATGGLLALAGALMQILLRNPLADPYALGFSGGGRGGGGGGG